MSLDLDKSTWKRVAFGDVVRNVNITVRDPETAGIHRVIAMEHLDPGELKIERYGSVEDGTTFTRRVTPGQTLFGKRRAYQHKVAFAEFDAICSGDILTFEADETQILPSFLPFLVQSNEFFDHALGTSAGSLSPRTNWRDLSRYELDLPPLDEQKRIADLLWAVEARRSAQNYLSGASSDLASKLFEQISSQAESIPLRDWVTRIDAGRSPQASSEPAESGQFGVLKVSAVGRKAFLATENKRLLNVDEFRSGDAVMAGDILVTRANAVVGNVARPCMVTGNYSNLMLSDKTLRLVPAPGIPNRVLLEALRAPAYRAHVREVVNGTEAKNISQQKLLAGPTRALDPHTVRRLDEALRILDAAVEAVSAELDKLNVFRSSLSAEFFGGK